MTALRTTGSRHHRAASGLPGLLGMLAAAALLLSACQPVPPSPPGRSAPTGPARIFFTDLRSGPGRGGEGDAGAFVTIRGARFGSARGSSTVTAGGGTVAAYRAWSATEIVVQLGAAARSGEIVVNTAKGDSNGVPFTVRSGRIFFVSARGNNHAPGSFTAPWATVTRAERVMAAGDITYLMDGVSQTAEDNFDAALSIESSGSSGAPKALVAYPGATATIGSNRLEFGARVPNIGIAADDWVIAGLVLRGRLSALEIGGIGSSRWRVVGNDISCPTATGGQTACFVAALADHVAFLGNDVHDAGAASGTSKQYAAIYFTTDTNHVEVGWNRVHDNPACRAIQFHSSPLGGGTGRSQFDLVVHHNVIARVACDGLNFATVDPSRGRVKAYRNVIRSAGRGPDPLDGAANYACIHVATITNVGPDGRGAVEIANNVLEDCGRRGGPDAGAVSRGTGSPGLRVHLSGNVIRQRAGEAYVSPSTPLEYLDGDGNTWEGAGPAPLG